MIWLIRDLVGAQKMDLADPQFGGCSKKKIWLIRNLVCAQQKDLADPQFGGCSEKKDLADLQKNYSFWG